MSNLIRGLGSNRGQTLIRLTPDQRLVINYGGKRAGWGVGGGEASSKTDVGLLPD